MLESVYLTLIGISFLLMIISILTEKSIGKFILSSISGILFWFLAYVSTSVEIVTCSSNSCVKIPQFINENVWLFYGLAMLSALLSMIFIIHMIYGIKSRPAVENL